ncbi:MAG: MFS transporter [Coriobacteriia bacterium]|nr:MFS transporter [Coriobacteriia bacterium]
MTDWRPRWTSTTAWILYDMANTVFALGVGSRYFGLWVVEAQGRPDSYIGLATIVAMVVVILVAPWIGALSDHFGKRRWLLTALTLVAVTATAFLASGDVTTSLALYAAGTVAFHLATVVYDAMLTDVSTTRTRGRISGLGVAVGYLGSLTALGIGALLLGRFGYAVVFRGLAVAFLAFALPAFFLIRERPRARRQGRPPGILESPRLLVDAWRVAARYRGVVPFLFGRFLYTDAINTFFLFNAIYVKSELGYTDGQTDVVAALSVTAAVAGSLIGGRLVDLIGPRRVLHAGLYALMVSVITAVAAAVAHVPALGVAAGLTGGLGIGATWTSDRVYMTCVSPPRHLGELFGLYASVGRFATVLGPIMWALIVDVIGWGRPAALGILGIFLLFARAVLGSVDDVSRIWSAEEGDAAQLVGLA